MADAPVAAPAAAPAQSSQQAPAQTANQSQGKAQTPPLPATPAQPPKIYEVKVNGKIIKMTEQEVLSNASLAHAAQSKFDEAAKSRKQVDRIISTAKTNPIAALMDPELGLSKDQIRNAFEKWYSQEFIEPETLTPAERKAKANETELEKYRREDAERRKKAQDEELNTLTNKHREVLQKQITDALDASGLPRTKWIAQRMAFYMRQNLNNGFEAPMDLIVSQVRKDHQEITQGISDTSDVDQLIAMFGEGVINKIRAHDLKKLRESRQAKAPAITKYDTHKGPQRPSTADVNRRLALMRRGKL